jgi:adenylate cyclase
VKALKLKLLPEEKKAIEHRGTTNLEAFNLYLMARQYSVTGNLGDARRSEAIVRLCQRAVELDPRYARAWALIALARVNLRFYVGAEGDNGLEAAERALSLDENLAEAHAAKADVLTFAADYDQARAEIEKALRLDPQSYEVNRAAGRMYYSMRRIEDAIRYLENAATIMETDYWAAGMLSPCYKAIGDMEGARRAARRALERTEGIVAQDPNNGSAMGFAIGALATLGEVARAKDLINRAVLLDPDNMNMRYNLACASINDLRDIEGGLDQLAPLFATIAGELVNWAKTDTDLDAVREHPRFKAMLAAAEARVAAKNEAGS